MIEIKNIIVTVLQLVDNEIFSQICFLVMLTHMETNSEPPNFKNARQIIILFSQKYWFDV